MEQFKYYAPTKILFGKNTEAEFGELCKTQGASKVLVHFGGSSAKKSGLLDRVCGALQEAGLHYVTLGGVVPNPRLSKVYEGIEICRREKVDFILAVGGGSVMDAAKLASIVIGADYGVRDLLKDPTIAKKYIKSLMIPTTCGTGSEATCNSIVAIPEEQSKQGIVNNCMIPDYVILDAEMIRHLPPKVLAATGVDALAHVVECFTSNKATILSDTYAIEGAKKIFHNIREAYADGDNMDAKTEMLIGAFYGGVAITGSGTTAVHALSYPLGGKYHIAHGVSNAILIAHVMEFNKDACTERLAALCDAVYPEKYAETADSKADYIISEIKDVVAKVHIPTKLDEFGVKKEDLDFLVKAGSQQTRLLVNNCKELSLDDIRYLYEKLF